MFKIGDVQSVEIADLNHQGEGVGKAAGFVLFVPEALPGETVTAEIISLHKSHAYARLLSRESSSPHRVIPPCPYYNLCGGCQLQHLSYEMQLVWKQKRVAASLQRIGKIEAPVLPTCGMPTPYRYRNKARVHLAVDQGRVTAGFYETQSHRVIDIEDCLVQHPVNVLAINTVRRVVQEQYSNKNVRTGQPLLVTAMVVRASFATGQVLVTLESAADSSTLSRLKQLAQAISVGLKDRLAGVVLHQMGKKGSRYTILVGQPFLEEEISPFRYRISSQSFFQVNSIQAKVLFEQVTAYAAHPRTAFDLYCGTGNFALYLSRVAEHVIGVDSASSTIADAKKNAATNGLHNLEFIKSLAEDIPALLLKGEHPKTILLDPPRKGCSPALLDAVVAAKPERIVYISCDPATLARDLAYLSPKGYLTQEIQPIDMFPQTSHVETVVLMSRV
ncbi:MAG TPA: 23S rRNA (uracil(1939)-C(5))-methyltransferase RlmD [Candidatus Limnocylindrales bacterium]|nr:23S rRNA (uracil(1939)-C(5))-methyltransferase RlmD [Candidatus Limnocylindrales bacterium]